MELYTALCGYLVGMWGLGFLMGVSIAIVLMVLKITVYK